MRRALSAAALCLVGLAALVVYSAISAAGHASDANWWRE